MYPRLSDKREEKSPGPCMVPDLAFSFPASASDSTWPLLQWCIEKDHCRSSASSREEGFLSLGRKVPKESTMEEGGGKSEEINT